MDILDLFKTLAEEPDKLGKRGVAVAKLCISIIFACFLYRTFIGPYILIDFASIGQYAEFIVSGRLLLALLFLWLSHIALYTLGAELTFWILKGILRRQMKFKKLSKGEGALLRKALVWREYIEFDQNGNINAGDRVEELYFIIETFGNEEDDSEAQLIKHSLIRDAWQLCFSFSIVYFFILPYHEHTVIINRLIEIGLILIPATYVAMERLTELFSSKRIDMLNVLTFLIFKREIHKQLNAIGSIPYKKGEGEPTSEYIRVAGREFIFTIYDRTQEIETSTIKQYLTKIKTMGCPMVIFSRIPAGEQAKELFRAVEDDLILVYFEDQVDLKESFWRQQMNKKKGRIVHTQKSQPNLGKNEPSPHKFH